LRISPLTKGGFRPVLKAVRVPQASKRTGSSPTRSLQPKPIPRPANHWQANRRGKATARPERCCRRASFASATPRRIEIPVRYVGVAIGATFATPRQFAAFASYPSTFFRLIGGHRPERPRDYPRGPAAQGRAEWSIVFRPNVRAPFAPSCDRSEPVPSGAPVFTMGAARGPR
jgi:hypothetical protein